MDFHKWLNYQIKNYIFKRKSKILMRRFYEVLDNLKKYPDKLRDVISYCGFGITIAWHNSDEKIFRALFERYNMDPNIEFNNGINYFDNYLSLYCAFSNIVNEDIIIMLLQHGVNPNKIPGSVNIFEYGRISLTPKLLKCFVEHGLDLNYKCMHGLTLFEKIKRYDNNEIKKYMQSIEHLRYEVKSLEKMCLKTIASLHNAREILYELPHVLRVELGRLL